MRQGKSLNRAMIFIAAAAVVLVTIVLTMGSQTVGATGNPGSIFFANSLGPNALDNTKQPPGDKTKQAPSDTKQPPGDKKITICHVPKGNPGNAQTLTISVNAWKTDGSGEGGHGPGLHGGDYVGPCLTSAISTGVATAVVKPPWVAPVVTSPTCPAWLFYHSDRTGNMNIFRFDMPHANPSADVDVSKGSGSGVQDMSPASSPDGKYLAFTTNRDSNWEIYIGAADGSMQERVTYTNTAFNVSPMWSPDGKSVIYESSREGTRNIFLADMATGQETRLTDSAANDVNAFWSPDSQKILFQTNRDGPWQIYELTLSNKALKRLSDGSSDDVNPEYSPDGKQIVFRSFQTNGAQNTVLYTMNADGSNRRAISDPNGYALNPAWSPDNTLIAYQSNLMGAGDIYVYQVATGITNKLTNSLALNSAPTWYCNSSSTIVYTSLVNGKPQLYQIAVPPISAAPGTLVNAIQLTSDNVSNQNPQSSPAVEDASHRTLEGDPGIQQ
jgi:TolB protein